MSLALAGTKDAIVLVPFLAISLIASLPPHRVPTARECVAVSAEMILADSRVALVFSGRMVGRVYVGKPERPTYRATFEVDRVWKGTVPKRIDIYVSELSAEAPRFDEGREYVVIANRVVDSKLRQDMGLADAEVPAFAARACSGDHDLPPDIRKQLGKGSQPK